MGSSWENLPIQLGLKGQILNYNRNFLEPHNMLQQIVMEYKLMNEILFPHKLNELEQGMKLFSSSSI